MQDRQQFSSEIRPLGLNAILLRFGLRTATEITSNVRHVHAMLQEVPPEGTTQIAASLTSILLEFDPALVSRDDFASAVLQRIEQGQTAQVPNGVPKRLWTIPVCFDPVYAPQLQEAAAAVGTDVANVAQCFCETPLEVLTIGFAPGQPYIGLLPEAYDIPRQSELTPSVPAGALIFAVRQLIVFTTENATGWRHVGHSGFLPFHQSRQQPFLLQNGDRIRFEAVSKPEMDAILADNAEGLGRARSEVAT